MIYINGHSVQESYQGAVCWVVDNEYVYFHTGQLAHFLGITEEELLEAIY